MRKYELTVVFRPEDDQFKSALTAVREGIAAEKASILKENDWGVRDLAYPIGKQIKGHYIMFEADIEQASVEHLDRSLKLNNGVMKFLFVKQ